MTHGPTALVLAAGLSSRLRPVAGDLPKPLVPVGGAPLLQRTLDALVSSGIQRCVLVTGYRREKIEQFVEALSPQVQVRLVHNTEFATTGNNYSLSLAGREAGNGDVLLLDGDVLFDARILSHLLNTPFPDAIVIRRMTNFESEEVKVELDAERHVRRIGKHVDPLTAAGEAVGIAKFSAAMFSLIVRTLESRKHNNEFYEAAFQQAIDNGAKLLAVDSHPYLCMEIDTPEDLREGEAMAARIPR